MLDIMMGLGETWEEGPLADDARNGLFVTVHRDDFKAWLQWVEYPLPADALLNKWLSQGCSAMRRHTRNRLTRRDYLMLDAWELSEAVILLLGYTPLNENGMIDSLDMPPLEGGERSQQKFITKIALRAIDARVLPVVGKRADLLVNPADFLRWAQSKGYAIPDDLREAFILPQQDAEEAPDPSEDEPDGMDERPPPRTTAAVLPGQSESLEDRRVNAISDAAKALGYDTPLSIPRSGKVEIMRHCLEDATLFTDSTFPKAWQEAVRRKVVRLKDGEKYRPRK